MQENLDRELTGIVIDPGNGGQDQGSIGNGIVEKNMNLDISKYMLARFKELGVPVVMTRTEDVDLDAPTRVGKVLDSFGNSKDVIVISNHINTGGNEGAEVVYALRNDDILSKQIINNLAQEGQTVIKNYQRRLPSNPAQDYYAIIRDTPNTEAIIIEYGYADNINDATKLKNNYEDYAEAVVRAIMQYKNLNYIPPKNSKDYYTVKSGDTLWTIAKAYGTTVDKLKDINNLKSNSLSIGQILKVIDTQSSQDKLNSSENTYIVKSGDSLWKIAQKYNTSVGELQELNNLSTTNLSIGQELKIPSDADNSNNNITPYTVKSGDSLWKIASNYDTTVDKIKTANNLSSNILSIGQKLIIPTESKYKVYTVQNGDSLYLIAKNNNTTVDKLKNLNSLNTNTLMIGQKLLIPNA